MVVCLFVGHYVVGLSVCGTLSGRGGLSVRVALRGGLSVRGALRGGLFVGHYVVVCLFVGNYMMGLSFREAKLSVCGAPRGRSVCSCGIT